MVTEWDSTDRNNKNIKNLAVIYNFKFSKHLQLKWNAYKF